MHGRSKHISRRAPLTTKAPIMQIRQVELTNGRGLHARACAKVVELASQFRCNVCLVWNGRRASARSMGAVVLLAAGGGAEVRAGKQGPGEAEGMTRVGELIAGRFRRQQGREGGSEM